MREVLKKILKGLNVLRYLRGVRGALCILADGLADLFCFFFVRAHRPGTFRRILAIRLDRIGDMVLTTPALRALKETFPEAKLTILASRYTKDIIEGLPFVDEVLAAEDFTKKQLVGSLRAGGFDISLGFHPDMFVNYLPWKAGIPIRIGYKLCGSGIFLTTSLRDDRHQRIRHEVESALEVVSKIGAATGDRSLCVAVHEEGELFADEFFKKYGLTQEERAVVIHPGARQPYIRWRKQGFAEVADRLMIERKVKVILIGSESERMLVEFVTRDMREKPIVAVGLNLVRLISVFKRSRLFIGNSTGPMHLAAGLGVPVVAIFGATHPRDSAREWGPWGKGHVVVAKNTHCRACHPGDCADFKCMDAVTPGDVFDAAVGLLKD